MLQCYKLLQGYVAGLGFADVIDSFEDDPMNFL